MSEELDRFWVSDDTRSKAPSDAVLFMAIAEDRHDLLIADEAQETLHPAVPFDICDDSVCVEVRSRLATQPIADETTEEESIGG